MSEPRLFPEFFDLVGNVRAIRRLKPDPVPEALIMQMLEAGVQAASGQNTQPWQFVLIPDVEPKQWFARHYADAMYQRFKLPPAEGVKGNDKRSRQLRAVLYQVEHMHETPWLILVCGLRDWPFKVPEHERVGLAPPNYGAVYPCVQNMLLAARALGLGAALTTMHQVFEEQLHSYFEIPSDYGVVVTMPVGWPMGRFGPVSRIPARDKTHLNRWGTPLAGASGGAQVD